MEYQEFLCTLEKELNKRVKEGIKVCTYTATKNNGSKKQGIMFEEQGMMASQAIYLEDAYKRYQQGETLDGLMLELLRFHETARGGKMWDPSQFEEYDFVKEKVIFRLVHSGKNKEVLKEVPCVEILDLSLIFCILVDADECGTAVMQITNSHLQMWGIEKEELIKDAVRNMPVLLPAEFFTMRHAIEEMLDSASGNGGNILTEGLEEKGDIMYVLTNPIRCYGASCLAYPYLLEMIGEILGKDFYILPSSVHEVIIMPETIDIGQAELDEMIAEINETQVEPEDVLSSHAYYYCRAKGQFQIGRDIQ